MKCALGVGQRPESAPRLRVCDIGWVPSANELFRAQREVRAHLLANVASGDIRPPEGEPEKTLDARADHCGCAERIAVTSFVYWSHSDVWVRSCARPAAVMR